MKKVEISERKLMKLYFFILNAHRRGGICGQGFTNYTCGKCDQEKSHPNTATPIFCPDCEVEIRDYFGPQREGEE